MGQSDSKDETSNSDESVNNNEEKGDKGNQDGIRNQWGIKKSWEDERITEGESGRRLVIRKNEKNSKKDVLSESESEGTITINNRKHSENDN